MTADQYWKQLQDKNPQLTTADTMHLSVESFRRAIVQAFEAGAKGEKDSLEFLERLLRK